MAGKKPATENTKKVAGNAKKAEAAAAKDAVRNAQKAAVEDEEWGKGAKNNAKKEAEAAKKADAERKKAEKAALLAEEEKSLKAAKATSSKTAAPKKSRGLDLSQLDAGSGSTTPSLDNSHSSSIPTLNASGIDNALDALTLTSTDNSKIDKHPERRFKAAYAAFEDRRLQEMEADGTGQGLRQNQRKERIRKEFERSDENPFNAVNARYDSTRDEIRDIREGKREEIERRLGGR